MSDLEERVTRLEQEMRERERRESEEREAQLKWGLRITGGLILIMGTYIWQQIGHIFNFGGDG